VVVGGGLIGVEMAEMLRSRDIEVTFLVRENQFWDNVLPQQEASLISRHIREHHVDLKLATELREIQGDENGRVKAVVTGNGEVIECQFVGLTAGVSPNIEFLRNSEIEINRGIQVNEFLETNIPNVYAIGDCCELKSPPVNRRSMEPVWYTGRIMGETVAQTITGTRTAYDPGNWFNSAKFFDIEYQTYGTVDRELKQGQEEFFWVYKCGRKCMHFIFESKSRKLIGVNSFGIRLRQEVFDRWLNEGKRIDEVINNLKKANFDPEFYKRYEREIKEIFFNEFPEMAEELKEGKSVFNTIER
ncbi:MAG: NAD(P)/FAD-dependent oxidoreductase, partial [Cyclobacteriaceae bacterium]|nr:NAD(P)/FAD-dependent oxidoreductase [Cyclobacteriaceae bacterium]